MDVDRRLPHVRGGEPFITHETGGSPTGFPTCVGVNRRIELCGELAARLPHVRGGEPYKAEFVDRPYGGFPTCVGVNRRRSPATCRALPGFPTCVGVNRWRRRSGLSAAEASPRAWG